MDGKINKIAKVYTYASYTHIAKHHGVFWFCFKFFFGSNVPGNRVYVIKKHEKVLDELCSSINHESELM